MKKSTLAYIENNDKAYKYYIYKVNRIRSALWSVFLVLLIGVLIFQIREIFLKREALDAASRTVIEGREVSEWVNDWMEAERWDTASLCIVGMTIAMIVLVIVTNMCHSYKIYKWRFVKCLPTALAIILLGVLWIEYNEGYGVLLLLTLVELIPLSVNFSTFLPLVIREDFNNWINLFSFLGQKIIKHM